MHLWFLPVCLLLIALIALILLLAAHRPAFAAAQAGLLLAAEPPDGPAAPVAARGPPQPGRHNATSEAIPALPFSFRTNGTSPT